MREPSTFFPSLTQLRAFQLTARLGRISSASNELHRSQSAVTQAIHHLEAYLGVALLKRSSAGCFLTEMGEVLLKRVDTCLSRIVVAVQDVAGGSLSRSAATTAVQRMTRAQILALLAVHEHGSFSQAARHVAVSHNSLNRSARGLERLLGLPLLTNTPHGVATNAAGSALSNQLSLAIRELEWAAEEIEAKQGAERGRLLIGGMMLAGTNFAALAVDKFTRNRTDLKVTIVSGTYDALLSKLRAGAIDFLVGLLKPADTPADIVLQPLEPDPFVVVVNQAHPLASREEVSLDDLAAFEWVAPQARRSMLERLFGTVATPRFNLETHSLSAIFILLQGGNRMSLLTRSELMQHRLGIQLTALNYAVTEPPGMLGVTVRRDWEPTRLQQDFLAFLASQSRSS